MKSFTFAYDETKKWKRINGETVEIKLSEDGVPTVSSEKRDRDFEEIIYEKRFLLDSLGLEWSDGKYYTDNFGIICISDSNNYTFYDPFFKCLDDKDSLENINIESDYSDLENSNEILNRHLEKGNILNSFTFEVDKNGIRIKRVAAKDDDNDLIFSPLRPVIDNIEVENSNCGLYIVPKGTANIDTFKIPENTTDSIKFEGVGLTSFKINNKLSDSDGIVIIKSKNILSDGLVFTFEGESVKETGILRVFL